jgi:hypothetical protein
MVVLVTGSPLKWQGLALTGTAGLLVCCRCLLDHLLACLLAGLHACWNACLCSLAFSLVSLSALWMYRDWLMLAGLLASVLPRLASAAFVIAACPLANEVVS